MKQNLINLSIGSDLVIYSTYESFGQYCDGWVYGRILNITYKTNYCFKVNIKIDNNDKIYFLTAFDEECLLPSYQQQLTPCQKISVRQRNLLFIIKKPNQDIEMNNYYFNIKSISDE